MTPKYRLVVFDWDGTLMDSVGHIVASMQGAMTDMDLPVLAPEAIRNIIGLGMREAVHALFPDDRSDVFLERFTGRYRDYYFAPDAPQKLFPGAERMLQALREEGYLLAVATGKSRHGLDHALSETGLDAMFHTSRTADETASKPDPRMLVEILAHLDVPPAAAVMVGDTEYDLDMASRAGMASVGVSFGVHAPERLRRHGPLACLDDLETLPLLLNGGNMERARA